MIAQTIALDTSAIFAVLALELEAALFTALIARRRTLIGVPTLVEARPVMERLSHEPAIDLRGFPGRVGATIVTFDNARLEAAAAAFHHCGKGGGHPAQLNLGEWLSYAFAKVHAVPLLFKGNAFPHTDLVPASGAPS